MIVRSPGVTPLIPHSLRIPSVDEETKVFLNDEEWEELIALVEMKKLEYGDDEAKRFCNLLLGKLLVLSNA